MKTKLLKAMSALMMSLTMISLTACDEDTQMSMTISGQWRGNFGMFYDYEYRGEVYRYTASETHIYFEPNSSFSTRGRGWQEDYYRFGPYENMYYTFHWEVRDGILYLDYPYDPALSTAIYDYRLSRGLFTGRFAETGSTFYLIKEEIYDWSPYTDYYYYDPRDDWYYYYAPTRSAQSEGDEAQEGRIVRRGNSLASPQ